MQWAFVIDGQPSNTATFVNVPDETTPPSPGDQVSSLGELKGFFTVKSREFLLEVPCDLNDKTVFGWSFTLTPKAHDNT